MSAMGVRHTAELLLAVAALAGHVADAAPRKELNSDLLRTLPGADGNMPAFDAVAAEEAARLARITGGRSLPSSEQ